LPIVSTRHAGAVDFIRDGQEGYLVDVRDPEALAEKITMVLEDKKQAQEMGERAYKRVADFSEAKSLHKWETFCRKTAGR
jgi:glycosyltransferase involved in cell wall biosynthesis